MAIFFFFCREDFGCLINRLPKVFLLKIFFATASTIFVCADSNT